MVKGVKKMRETRSDVIFKAINMVFIFVFLAVIIYPLIYVLSASISSPDVVLTGQMWLLPKEITFSGYERVLQNTDIWIGYRNTIFYTVVGTIISLVITVPGAYSLACPTLPGRKIISFVFLFTMFFSGGLIPLYLLTKSLHLTNTIWAVLIVPAASVWNIIITRTFFQSTIPPGIEEAAEIDGCSTFQKFFKIILPLSAPIIAVMALFYGVGRWNSYFMEMIFLDNRNLFPLQVFLRELLVVTQMNSTSTSTADAISMAEQAKLAGIIKYAIMIVSSLPIIIIYPFFQKYFTKGVMVGSIKG